MSSKNFIGEDMRLDPVRLTKDDQIFDLLEFYMGKNTPDRQDFIINNLRIEEDIIIEEDRIVNKNDEAAVEGVNEFHNNLVA
jgi:hypothetical protein